MTGRRCGCTSTATQVATTAHTGTITTLDESAADRRRQHLRPVLHRADRRGPRLQRRADGRADPDGHDHADGRRPRHPPPTAPGTLTATVVSGSEIDLAWGAATDNVGVTGYLVERCQGAGCSTFAQIATPDRHHLQRHRPHARPPATATACAPSTPPATSSPYSTPSRPPRSADTTPPTPPARLRRDVRSSASRDRPRLDGGDRQRRRHRLPGRALPGRRLHHLRPDRDRRPARPTTTRAVTAVDQLQLPRPRHRRRRQPQPLLQHRQRHHARRADTQPPTRRAR